MRPRSGTLRDGRHHAGGVGDAVRAGERTRWLDIAIGMRRETSESRPSRRDVVLRVIECMASATGVDATYVHASLSYRGVRCVRAFMRHVI